MTSLMSDIIVVIWLCMKDFRTFLAECLQNLPENLSSVKDDIKSHFEQRLENELRANNLVLREEFDIQCQILADVESRLSKIENEIES